MKKICLIALPLAVYAFSGIAMAAAFPRAW